jgi:uncharacterized repeat protein (TIGR01451 family)
MESGVVVQMSRNSQLLVEGALVGQGTAAEHINIGGVSDFQTYVLVTGTLDLNYTDITARIEPGDKGSLLFTNCKWTGAGAVYTQSGYLFNDPPFVQFEHCSFEGTGTTVWITNATVVLRDVAFSGGAYGLFYYVYMYLDDVRSDDSSQFGLQFKIDERLYINNVRIRNASSAALDLGGGNAGGNFFLGPNNVLQGSLYPVQLDSAGLLSESVVPTDGNVNNYVSAGDPGQPDWRGGFTWAPLAIPYVVKAPLNIAGRWVILPGTTVQFGPDFAGISDQTSGLIARGTTDAPILFQRFDPAQPWGGINFRTRGNRIAHVILEGSTSGVNTTTQNGGQAYVEDMLIRNNELGSHGGVYVIGTRYLNNQIGYQDTGGLTGSRGNLNAGPASPNSFEGNGVAAYGSTNATTPARNNWWNSPTGPTHPNNPGGTGDPVKNAVDYVPFLTAPPDYTDAPPVVVQHRPDFTYNAGDGVTISWDSSDDHGIVAHRILFSPASNGPTSFQTVIDNLPGDARSYEWTVPNIGFQNTDPTAYIRVVAVDTAGHERFDDQGFQIPSGEVTGNLAFTSPTGGQTFRPGQKINVTWTQSEFSQSDFEMYVYLENEQRTVSQGGGFVTYGSFTATMPYTSTDRARILFKSVGSRNRVKYFYSPAFKIRPDARVGDAPATIALQTPLAGDAFATGDTIPITWQASDDEATRSFDIQISYDGGRGWTKIASDLDGATRSYDFKSAPGAGFSDVRVKVIAFDRRFQQTSDGADRSFSLTPTAPPNHAPTVSMTRPGKDSIFNSGARIILSADAADTDGIVTKVEFYDGSTLIGSDTAAPYQINWTGAEEGGHTLTAKATDERGSVNTSDAVNVTVQVRPQSPTNINGASWAALYNGPSNANDEKPGMVLNGRGNVIITGQSKGIGTGTDIATIKYDANGNQLWVARYNGAANGSDIPYALAADAIGNIYVTGTTWRGSNLQGGTEYDYVTLKYDANGNQLWAKYYSGANARSFDDIPTVLQLDASGNVYVTGGSKYNGAFNFLVSQVATIKYDSNGNEVWTRTYDSPDRQGASGSDLKLDASGNVYITGTVNANLGNPNNTTQNVLTLKYDSAGALLWARQYDDPGPVLSDFDRGERVELDSQGNVYVLGAGVNEPNTTDYDVLLLKYTNAGDLLKVKTWDSTAGVNTGNLVSDDPNDWAFDGAGNFYVTGRSDSQSDYGLIFTLKFDADLNLQWERLYNGPTGSGYEAGFSLALDGAKNVFVTGPSINTDNDYDFLLLKYRPDGTEEFAKRFEGPAQLDDIPQEIAIDDAGNLYLAGDTRTTGGDLDFLTLKIDRTAAVLNISMTADRNPAPVGLNFNYKPVITNTGNASATNVVLTDVLPALVTFTASSASQGTCTYAAATRAVTCNLGTIANGSSANVQITVKPRDEGTLDNTATITSGQWDAATGSASVNGLQARKMVDLSVTKVDSVDPIFVGGETTYTMVVKNSNTTINATGVALTDSLSSSMTFVSATTTQGTLVTPPIGSNGIVTANVGTLAPNATATVKVTVKGAAAGVWTNTAQVSCNETDSNTSNNSASQTTTVKAVVGLQKILLAKQTLTGGCENTTGNVYLTGPAPAGGASVFLSGNVSGVSVPAYVDIPGGQTVSPAFTVTTNPVAAKQTGLVTATSGPNSVSRGVTINMGNGICP